MSAGVTCTHDGGVRRHVGQRIGEHADVTVDVLATPASMLMSVRQHADERPPTCRATHPPIADEMLRSELNEWMGRVN